ncbi:hypothetical protein L0Y69_01800 [bacterium]|nr:hypothetical protein [bacterium]
MENTPRFEEPKSPQKKQEAVEITKDDFVKLYGVDPDAEGATEAIREGIRKQWDNFMYQRGRILYTEDHFGKDYNRQTVSQDERRSLMEAANRNQAALEQAIAVAEEFVQGQPYQEMREKLSNWDYVQDSHSIQSRPDEQASPAIKEFFKK